MDIQDGKFVELTYKIIDEKTGNILSAVEFPLGYVHGKNEILSPEVMAELIGKSAGDVIELPIDCEQLYGHRDESLVFTSHINNVPEEYHKLGTTVTMENDKGEVKNFIVTCVDEKSVTVDGNNPLCGRKVVFILEIVTVRDATDEEINNGGPINTDPVIANTKALH